MLYQLNLGDVFRLETLRTLTDLELNKLPLVQRLVAVHLDGREVNEDVFPRLTLDETIPFCCIEPLHHTLFSSQRCLLLFERSPDSGACKASR